MQHIFSSKLLALHIAHHCTGLKGDTGLGKVFSAKAKGMVCHRIVGKHICIILGPMEPASQFFSRHRHKYGNLNIHKHGHVQTHVWTQIQVHTQAHAQVWTRIQTYIWTGTWKQTQDQEQVQRQTKTNTDRANDTEINGNFNNLLRSSGIL